MPEVEIAQHQQAQRRGWKKRFRRKAKKIGKALLCTSCTSVDNLPTDEKHPSSVADQNTPLPTFASVATQTDVPPIFEELRHEGETMMHRPTDLNSNSNGIGENTSFHATSVKLKSGATHSKCVKVHGEHLPSHPKIVMKKIVPATAGRDVSKPVSPSGSTPPPPINAQCKKDACTGATDSVSAPPSQERGNTSVSSPKKSSPGNSDSSSPLPTASQRRSALSTWEELASVHNIQERRNVNKLSTSDIHLSFRDDTELPPVGNNNRSSFNYNALRRKSSSMAECIHYAGLINSAKLSTANFPPMECAINFSNLFGSTGVEAAPLEVTESSTGSSTGGDTSDFCGESSNSAAIMIRQSSSPEGKVMSSPDNSPLPKLSLKSKLLQLLCISRKEVINSTVATKEAGTQLFLDAIEAAYLHSGIAGFYNLGNTCFMNSVIHCLSHTLEMTDIFLSSNKLSGQMCLEYQKAMQSVWLQPSVSTSAASRTISAGLQALDGVKYVAAVDLSELKQVFGDQHADFQNEEQQDGQEFLRLFIADLHCEMKRVNTAIPEAVPFTELSGRDQGKFEWELTQSQEGSPISDIFMGQFKSSLECTVCRQSSYRFESFWDMGLPLVKPRPDESSVNLHSCLSQFCQSETMDGFDSPFCVWCHQRQPFIKKMMVQRFPPILTLYLTRFYAFGGLGKLTTAVTIPTLMDLSHLASPETRGENTIIYQLYGVVNHSGNLHNGHYTAIVQHYASQQWFKLSDLGVARVDMQTEMTSSEPYMLFYRRLIV